MIPQFFQKTCYQTYQQTDVDSESDSRPWLVLIHGLGMQQEMWQWQIPALSAHYRIVTYDLYDHGKSRARGMRLRRSRNFLPSLLICLTICKLRDVR